MEKCLKMVTVVGTLLLRTNNRKREIENLKNRREAVISNLIGNLYSNNHKKSNIIKHVRSGSNTIITVLNET